MNVLLKVALSLGVSSTLLMGDIGYTCPGGVVSSDFNDGNSTLRACIGLSSNGDTITFTNDMNIVLASDIGINDKSLSIDGGAHAIVLDGNKTAMLLYIGNSLESNITVNLSNLTMQNAYDTLDGAALNVYGSSSGNNIILNMNNTNVQYNNGDYGAIYTEYATLNVVDSTISNNRDGGAVRMRYSVLNISNSTLLYNLDEDKGGGAIRTQYSIVTIDNSILSNNSAPDSGGGGAIMVMDSELNISNLTLSNNTAYGSGGAIRIKDDSSLTISDSTFSENLSYDNSGGAIAGGDHSNIDISNTKFLNNSNNYGGVVKGKDYTSILIKNSIFLNNKSFNDGPGAVYVKVNSNVTIIDSQLSNNMAMDSAGGAVGAKDDSNITISGSTLSNNFAGGGGGAIRLYNNCILTMSNSTLSGNTAEGGGAIVVKDSSEFNISNSTISGNSDSGYGGAIYLYNSDIGILNHVTITNNISASGLQAIGTNDALNTEINVSNSIISGNGSGKEFEAIRTLGHNLLGDGTLLNAAEASDTVDVDDPLLDTLAYNGGNTPTHLPLETSLAIENGTIDGLPTDQLGHSRSDAATIGAIEFFVVPVHEVVIGGVKTVVTSSLNSAKTEILADGSIRTVSGRIDLGNGYYLEAVAITTTDGKTQTMFVKVNEADPSDRSIVSYTYSESTPFDIGATIIIEEINGVLYIVIRVPLNGKTLIVD